MILSLSIYESSSSMSGALAPNLAESEVFGAWVCRLEVMNFEILEIDTVDR